MENREMREKQEMSGQKNLHRGELSGSGKTKTKKSSISGIWGYGITAVLLSLAVILSSCDSGSKGSDPQVEDSSSSVTDPASSGSVIASSGSVVTSSSSAKSSSSTQINSSSSVIGSSGSMQSSSSGVVSSSSEEPCEEGARELRYFPSSQQWIDYICTSGTWVVYVASSSSAASSSSYYNMDSLFSSIENLSYGEFTDPRDGQVYKTIIVNPGKLFEYEIFAENLNYGREISGGTEQTDSTKYCYNDDPWYCDHYFGGLYQWSEAMDFPSACNDVKAGSTAVCPDSIVLSTEYSEPEFYVQHQGICPDGWHVMNEGEWATVIGGGDYTLKSRIVWQYGGTNNTGLSILPAGYRDSTGAYSYLGSQAYFWLPQEYEGVAATLSTTVDMNNDYLHVGSGYRKTRGYAVRCVKDHEGL